MAISARLVGKNMLTVTDEDLAAAYEKLSLQEIATQLKTTAQTIRLRLKAAGHERRPPGPVPAPPRETVNIKELNRKRK